MFTAAGWASCDSRNSNNRLIHGTMKPKERERERERVEIAWIGLPSACLTIRSCRRPTTDDDAGVAARRPANKHPHHATPPAAHSSSSSAFAQVPKSQVTRTPHADCDEGLVYIEGD
jgi:hypothetical protein